MNATEVLTFLKEHGTAQTAKTYRRHGVLDECYGVSYADMGKLQKKLGRDHALAQALWDSGYHEAKVMAIKIADPAKMTKTEIGKWQKGVRDHVITFTFSGLVAQTPHAESLGRKWIESKDDHQSACGWGVLGALGSTGQLEPAELTELIARIERDIHGSKNWTKYAMNTALIAFGGSVPEVTKTALAAAKAIGVVDVDHGDTACKTPEAISYIKKMVERNSTRKAPWPAKVC